MKTTPLIALESVWLEYPNESSAHSTTVLEDINLQIWENDIMRCLDLPDAARARSFA